MSPYEPITLGKQAVAKCQLETAIKLWSEEGDPASIHTLAVAANAVFDALGKRIGAPSFIREYLRGASKAEYDKFTEAEVFFKHADRDLNKTLDYDRMQAEVLIFDSIWIYEALHDDKTPPMLAFVLHFSIHHPTYFEEIWASPLPKGFDPEELVKLNRKEFFARIIALLDGG